MTSYFKQRYDSDPEYKQKHLAYLKEPVECECGISISRTNMIKHKGTTKHANKMAEKNQKVMSNDEYEKMVEDIARLKKKLKNALKD